jgi:hypothetical protein
MEKFYKLMDWLEMSQAIDYLQTLVETPYTEMQLLQLCEAGQCFAFARIGEGITGVRKTDIGHYQPAHFDQPNPFELIPDVTGTGVQRVLNPTALAASGFDQAVELEMIGMVTYTSGGVFVNKEESEWKASLAMRNCAPLFRPSDIKALADKMNEASQPPSYTAELEELRQQLEQERAKLEGAEAKIAELQNSLRIDAEILKTSEGYTGFLHDELQQERDARKALDQRASQAEAQVEALRHEIEDSYSIQQTVERDAEDVAYHRWTDEKYNQPETLSTGLLFPYATRHLEAMRAAALEHWSEHDRSKPAPYGIQKKVQAFLATRTGENARKLIELAAAIKPDDLPKS